MFQKEELEMTVEELGHLCVDYGLHITFKPILRGVEIEMYDVRADESEFRIANTRNIASTIKDMMGFEEKNEDAT